MRKCLLYLWLMALALPVWAQDTSFEKLVKDFTPAYLRLNPELATTLGDHRYDGQLSDYSQSGLADANRLYAKTLQQLQTIDPLSLSPVNRVDYEILKSNLKALLFALEELQEFRWNPLIYNPGSGLYSLMARDFAPLPKRLESLAKRLDSIPRLLEQAKSNLDNPPLIHTKTAIDQNKGTLSLIKIDLDAILAETPKLREKLAPSRKRAADALEAYGKWLEKDLLPRSKGDFRLGSTLYSKKLAYTLESELPQAEILKRAEAELLKTREKMAKVAAEVLKDEATAYQTEEKLIRAALNRCAQSTPNNDTVVGQAAADLSECTAFVREHKLVSLTEDACEVIEMPEFARGVAVAYCDSPGPLEANAATFYAIAPTPKDWSTDRVSSFFREYNDSMLKDLTVHEAMPGHFLQLMHSNRFKAPTLVRSIFQSGTFIEGWATYAEQVMANQGYGGPQVQLQQLKMRLRLIINAIIDQKIHTAGMTEAEVMNLMMNSGFQEEGEAAGKWRRACLTSAQLSTYFVGNAELNDLVQDFQAKHPGTSLQALHDLMLSFGSPAPRYLRQAMGL